MGQFQPDSDKAEPMGRKLFPLWEIELKMLWSGDWAPAASVLLSASELGEPGWVVRAPGCPELRLGVLEEEPLQPGSFTSLLLFCGPGHGTQGLYSVL